MNVNVTPILHFCYVCTSIPRHFVKLLLCCYLSHGNRTYNLLAGGFNIYCHITSKQIIRPLMYVPILGAERKKSTLVSIFVTGNLLDRSTWSTQISQE
jgi:hypothetical protein